MADRLGLALEAAEQAVADDQDAAVVAIEIGWRRGAPDGAAACSEQQMTALAPAGRLPQRNYSLTAVALVGATDGLLIDWLSSDPRPPRDAVIEGLVEIAGLIET